MTSSAFHPLQKGALHQSYSGLPVKNLERYQRSWKLDVGFQKLQKRISERIKRENTLPPITFTSHPSTNGSATKRKDSSKKTTAQEPTSHKNDPSAVKLTQQSKSELSCSDARYRNSNNGATRLTTARKLQKNASFHCSSSFTLDEDTNSDEATGSKEASQPALSMADLDRLNRHWEEGSEEEREDRITRWLRDCDLHNCHTQLPYQQKETVSFSKFKPRAPTISGMRGRQGNVLGAESLIRSQTML